MKIYAFRFHKRQNIKKELKAFVKDNNIQAGVIITAVGSADKAVIRMAGASPEKSDMRTYKEKLEIVSLVRTISQEDSHIHMALSNKEGKVIGGHLKGEAIVDTTSEIVLGELEDVVFTTVADENTGNKEMKVVDRNDI